MESWTRVPASARRLLGPWAGMIAGMGVKGWYTVETLLIILVLLFLLGGGGFFLRRRG